jgi:hypothetical protein
MRSDFALGPIKVRLEVLPIVIGIALLSNWKYGLGLFAAICAHECGHAIAAQIFGGKSALTLQMTGGTNYIRDLAARRAQILTLLAGPVASAFFAALAILAGPEFFYAAAVWTVYQLMPFPPLDGGQILRIILLSRGIGATFAWRLGWISGLLLAAAIVGLDSNNLQAVVLLSGMAVILGRGESGYVRHLDAYALWEKQDHRGVLDRVMKLPQYLDREDRARLLELGLFSARELDDEASAAVLAAELPPFQPVVMHTGEWLLTRGNIGGAKIAQRALDAIDQERIKLTAPDDRERYADLTFRYAVYEARERRAESALGLLERAVDLGFADRDRIEADAELRRLADSPRWEKVIAKLS